SPPGDAAAVGAALVTVTAWGSAFVAIRHAGRELAPGSIALGRLIVCVVVLGIAACIRREPWPERGGLVRIALFGWRWLGVYGVSVSAAERHVDAGTAAMLINIGPILIAFLAGMFLGEGFPPRLFAGCTIAFAGCLLIGVGGSHAGSRAGIALLLLAAFAYATAVVVQKPALARASPFQVTWLGCVAGTVVCTPFLPQLIHDLAHAGATTVAATAHLGIAPTAIGFATWSYALSRMSAGRLASLAYLIPVVATVLGWLLLDETPPWPAAIGGALCLAGVYVARRRQGGATPPPRSPGPIPPHRPRPA